MLHSRHLPQCFRGVRDGRVGQEVLLSLGDPSCPLNPILRAMEENICHLTTNVA